MTPRQLQVVLLEYFSVNVLDIFLTLEIVFNESYVTFRMVTTSSTFFESSAFSKIPGNHFRTIVQS